MNRLTPSVPVALLAALALSPAAPCQEPAGDAPATISLTPKPMRKWSVLLPESRFLDVGGGFLVPHQGGERFLARAEGDVLKVDLDGDGQCEALVEGKTAFVMLSGKTPAGNPLKYAVRLQKPDGHGWQYSCGGAMGGEIDGVEVQFFDQDLNGRFDDYGKDAMRVGDDAAASLLSKVANIGGKLYSLDVAADGSSVRCAPYTGASGELDLTSSLTCAATLNAAVVQSQDGNCSFNLASGPLRVPAGSYLLHSGQLALGDGTAMLHRGRAQAITVEDGSKQVVTWGGPVRAEFAVHRDSEKVGFAPKEISYFGSLGEEFTDFMPLGKTPEFTIVDKASGEVLAVARFPGNC